MKKKYLSIFCVLIVFLLIGSAALMAIPSPEKHTQKSSTMIIEVIEEQPLSISQYHENRGLSCTL